MAKHGQTWPNMAKPPKLLMSHILIMSLEHLSIHHGHFCQEMFRLAIQSPSSLRVVGEGSTCHSAYVFTIIYMSITSIYYVVLQFATYIIIYPRIHLSTLTCFILSYTTRSFLKTNISMCLYFTRGCLPAGVAVWRSSMRDSWAWICGSSKLSKSAATPKSAIWSVYLRRENWSFQDQ